MPPGQQQIDSSFLFLRARYLKNASKKFFKFGKKLCTKAVLGRCHWTVSCNKSRVFLPRSHLSDNIFKSRNNFLLSILHNKSQTEQKKGSFCRKTRLFFLLLSIGAKHLCSVAVLDGTLNADLKKSSGDSLSVCCNNKLPRLSLFSPWNN